MSVQEVNSSLPWGFKGLCSDGSESRDFTLSLILLLKGKNCQPRTVPSRIVFQKPT